MALIAEFSKGDRSLVLHPTTVTCIVHVGRSDDGKTLVQLDTHGSTDREIPGKLSQTLQLDEKAALELWTTLGTEFGFKK